MNCSTSRILWLTWERLPHPEAVIHPADEREVRLVLSLMEYPIARRAQLIERLKNIFQKIFKLPVFDRPSIPARMANGLYFPVNWRFALWLSRVLSFEGSRKDQLVATLQNWLAEGSDGDVFSPCCATQPH
jgi:hypothetical protein